MLKKINKIERLLMEMWGKNLKQNVEVNSE